MEALRQQPSTVEEGQARAPIAAAPRPSVMEHVATFYLAQARTVTARDRRTCDVAPGQYQVIGAVSLDGQRVLDAAIAYQGLDRETKGSVALTSARVKVGGPVSPLVSRSGRSYSAGRENCCAADRPLPSSRICLLRIICISSTPLRMICARRKSLKPCTSA
jgi:hypothetical protein